MSAPSVLSILSPDSSGPSLFHLPHPIPESLAPSHLRQSSTSVHRLHASPSEEDRERERERDRAATSQLPPQQPLTATADADKERGQSRGGDRDSGGSPSTAADAPPAVEPASVSIVAPIPHALALLSTSSASVDERPHSPQPLTPPPSRSTPSIPPPPALRASTLTSYLSDAHNTSPDNGLHHSGEKRAPASSYSAAPSTAPPSRPPSRQLSTSDAPIPIRSTSGQQLSAAAAQAGVVISEPKRGYSVLSPPTDRPLKVTNEALSLRKQSLRHPPTSSSTPLSLAHPSDTADVSLLHRHIAFQDQEASAYKKQILSLTSENTRLAAELRAYPHSAAEMVRLLSSLRGEVKGLEGRVGVLMGEKKVWGVKMKNFHAEMSHMEREYIKDRQRLEEALRREEERGERMRLEWEGREDKMQAMMRERRREQEELDAMRLEAREMERRWVEVQGEYERMMAAWREERVTRQEVEGTMKGEMYSTLFALIKQVGEYERRSREWEREMGRREQLQRGLEELERRYTRCIDAVQERDRAIEQLREDNRRLIALLQEESRRGLTWYQQGPAGANAVHSGSAAASGGVEMRSPTLQPSPSPQVGQPPTHHTPAPYGRRRSGSLNPSSMSSLPFPSLVEGHEVELPRASSAAAAALPVPAPLPSPSSTPPPPDALPSRHPSLSSSSSVPNLNSAATSTKAGGDAELEEMRLSSLTVPTSSASTLSSSTSPSTASSSSSSSAPASVRSAVLTSPSSYLSAFLTSASQSITPSKAKAAAFDFFLTPKGSAHPLKSEVGQERAGEERKQRAGEGRDEHAEGSSAS